MILTEQQRLESSGLAMSASDEVRQAFEAWFSNNVPDCQSIRRDAEGNYMLMQACQAWVAWKRCAEWYSQSEIESSKGIK